MSNGREPKAQIFRRESTGLVREMNAFDVAWWGIAGTGGLYLLFYFMPYAQYYLPGSNLALTIALVSSCDVTALRALRKPCVSNATRRWRLRVSKQDIASCDWICLSF